MPTSADSVGHPVTRVLLLGASGRLGDALARELGCRPQFLVIAPARDALGSVSLPVAHHEDGGVRRWNRPARPPLSGLDPIVAQWFVRWRPDVVVNCIAMSDVDLCETDSIAAWRLNAALPAALAGAARQTLAFGTPGGARGGTRLVHFSSDFVFDGKAPDDGAAAQDRAGAKAPRHPPSAHDRAAIASPSFAERRPYRESDPPNPLSIYGESKLAGERAIARSGCRHWTFRVSWLYGAPVGNLAARLLEPASAGQTIRLAADRIGVPNPVQLIAREVTEALERDASSRRDSVHSARLPPSGLYHLSCHGATSWYEFGREFLRQALAAGALPASRALRLEPFEETAAARPAPRPLWSPLDPGHYEAVFGRQMPQWQEAIAEVLRPAARRGSART